MVSLSEFAARGKVLRVDNNTVVFTPANTTYELHLACPGPLPQVTGRQVSCLIRGQARKVWTVPSGGNFVTPIVGPTRIVQGRIKYLDEVTMVVHGGVPVVVTLPKDNKAYDLINGPLQVAAMVNATILPGATFELVEQHVAV